MFNLKLHTGIPSSLFLKSKITKESARPPGNLCQRHNYRKRRVNLFKARIERLLDVPSDNSELVNSKLATSFILFDVVIKCVIGKVIRIFFGVLRSNL